MRVGNFVFKINVKQYPDAIQYPNGTILYKKGVGLYPYNCKIKDQYPQAMIYENKNGGWSAILIEENN